MKGFGSCKSRPHLKGYFNNNGSYIGDFITRIAWVKVNNVILVITDEYGNKLRCINMNVNV
jgi:hypothetical protein